MNARVVKGHTRYSSERAELNVLPSVTHSISHWSLFSYHGQRIGDLFFLFWSHVLEMGP